MGTLYITATPIGNLEDITHRAFKTLFSVDFVACEDTRRTGSLLQELKKRYAHLGNTSAEPRLLRYDDRTEQTATPEILELLKHGKSVALVSDAGTPLISDPGYVLVREARKRGIPVVSVPGPSAILAALTSSGLPVDKFLFLGYPPEKPSHRLELFRKLLQMNQLIATTYIMYCAPHKLRQTLKDMVQIFGDREVCVGRELTKIHEEIWRGKFSEAMQRFVEPQGEFVILWSLGSN